MEDMIRKIVSFEVKEVADRVLEFVGSTETKDRTGEIIDSAGWQLKEYKKNPVFMWAHSYQNPPVGKANKVWIEDSKLKFHIQFATKDEYEFADTIYKLYKGGYLRASSVGFLPIEWEEIETKEDEEASFFGSPRHYTKQNLLELSGCAIPANPEALIEARQAGLITTKELEVITKPEETDDWIRIPVAECEVTATIDISKKEGIKALYCGKEKKVRTYMFDKRAPFNWTMAKAKKWVEEHKGVDEEDTKSAGIEVEEILEHPMERTVGQGEIKDEIDYLTASIKAEGLNDDNQEVAWALVREVMRIQGNDMPLDIAEKVGAVLNQKNKERLGQIIALAQQILDSAQHEEEPEKAAKPEITLDEIIQIVKGEVTRAISKAQGKVNIN